MIDRKALAFTIAVIAATTGALIWRLSLLPDWHHMPLDGPGGGKTIDGVKLFIAPFAAAGATACLYLRKYFVSGTDEALAPWRRWASMFAIANSAIIGLFFAVIIARSFGYGLAVDRLAISRGMMVAAGLVVMAVGNALPKLPWVTMRFRWFQLDPWQQTRQLRFMGKMIVGLGLFAAASPWLLPPKMGLPVMLGLWLAMIVAMLWYRAKLKREPSPQ